MCGGVKPVLLKLKIRCLAILKRHMAVTVGFQYRDPSTSSLVPHNLVMFSDEYPVIRNKNGLGVSCLVRYGFYDVDCFWSDSKSD